MSDTRTNLTLVVGYDGSDASRRAIARVRELAIDYREHLKDVGNEPIVFAEQEHVESGGEVAGDTREDTDLLSPRASVEHRPW